MSTFVSEGAPEHQTVETLTLDEVDGGTLVTGVTVHGSIEARGRHVDSGIVSH